MTRGEIAFAIISGLLVNEATDVCPWVAIRLVRWAARLRYPHAPERAAIRSVEHAAVIKDRPGKLLKLFTALGFALDALVAVRRDRKPVGMTGWRAAAKRTIDVGIATVFLALTLPLWVAIAVAIRLTSPGPVFFQQWRMTKRGRVFGMYRFRTMRTPVGDDADATTPYFKLHDDPRITRVGAFLRRYGFDVAPVFWNVLKGDMSIVGPQPLSATQAFTYLQLSPLMEAPAGLISWRHVQDPRLVSPEEAVRLDLFYIENWSLSLDLYILFKSLVASLRQKRT